MKFQTEFKLGAGKNVQIECPDNTAKYLVPSKIVVAEQVAGQWTPARKISLKISCANREFVNMEAPAFRKSNEIDLTNDVECGELVLLKFVNNSRDHKTLRAEIFYKQATGVLMLQEYTNNIDDALSRVTKSGRVLRIYLGFNRPVPACRFIPTFTCDEEWLAPFELPETDSDNTYDLDFTGEDLQGYNTVLHTFHVDVEDLKSKVSDLPELEIAMLCYGFKKP